MTLKLHGQTRGLDVEPSDILLDVLRESLGVKSPKIGCERGDCGACTVLLDGKTARTCLIQAIEVDGHEITTLGGLSRDWLTPLQRSLLEHNSFQCGFCAALAAMVKGQPVKVGWSRGQEFYNTYRRRGVLARIKLGVKKDGTITAIEHSLHWDAGGCVEYGANVVNAVGLSATGP